MNFSFEILEWVMVETEDEAFGFHVDRIREAGFSVGLDDFGSGHAPVLPLLRISADFIKFDGDLVTRMTQSRRHYPAIRASVAMARECGARITAESVGTAQQAQMLRALGCDVLQGFLFARPVGAVELGKVLKAASAETGSDLTWRAALPPPHRHSSPPNCGTP